MWKWAQRRERANTYWRRNPNPSLLTPKMCIETTAPWLFMIAPITLQFASGYFLLIPNCLTSSVKITREMQAVFHICLSIGGKGKKKNLQSWVSCKGAPKSLPWGKNWGQWQSRRGTCQSFPAVSKIYSTTTTAPTIRQPEGSKGRATGKSLPRGSPNRPLNVLQTRSLKSPFSWCSATARNNSSGSEHLDENVSGGFCFCQSKVFWWSNTVITQGLTVHFRQKRPGHLSCPAALFQTTHHLPYVHSEGWIESSGRLQICK